MAETSSGERQAMRESVLRGSSGDWIPPSASWTAGRIRDVVSRQSLRGKMEGGGYGDQSPTPVLFDNQEHLATQLLGLVRSSACPVQLWPLMCRILWLLERAWEHEASCGGMEWRTEACLLLLLVLVLRAAAGPERMGGGGGGVSRAVTTCADPISVCRSGGAWYGGRVGRYRDR
ncbi:hypothetical protein BST61_g2269 [Cercospora zeina]